jgi:hypothetical protein
MLLARSFWDGALDLYDSLLRHGALQEDDSLIYHVGIRLYGSLVRIGALDGFDSLRQHGSLACYGWAGGLARCLYLLPADGSLQHVGTLLFCGSLLWHVAFQDVGSLTWYVTWFTTLRMARSEVLVRFSMID